MGRDHKFTQLMIWCYRTASRSEVLLDSYLIRPLSINTEYQHWVSTPSINTDKTSKNQSERNLVMMHQLDTLSSLDRTCCFGFPAVRKKGSLAKFHFSFYRISASFFFSSFFFFLLSNSRWCVLILLFQNHLLTSKSNTLKVTQTPELAEILPLPFIAFFIHHHFDSRIDPRDNECHPRQK